MAITVPGLNYEELEQALKRLAELKYAVLSDSDKRNYF